MIGQYVTGAMVELLKKSNPYNGRHDSALQSSDLTL